MIQRLLSLFKRNAEETPEFLTDAKPDKKIWTIFAHDAAIDVENLKTQMVIFCPSFDQRIAIELKRLASFPRAVINTHVDVAALSDLAGFTGVPNTHIAS